MSDEIDIEEHDVLDNPNIRRIFPDLSIIKKEISQYEEGLVSTPECQTAQVTDVDIIEAKPLVSQIKKQSSTSSETPADPKRLEIAQRAADNHRLEVHKRFKTFLDSLKDDIFEDIDIKSLSKLGAENHYLNGNSSSSHPNLHETSKPGNNDIKRLPNNILILGSKPSVRHPKITTTKRQLKVVLKNVNFYLNSSKRYCSHCLILFPNIDALMCHINDIHSLKTNPIKEYKKKNWQLEQKTSKRRWRCDICTISLSSRSNLVRHLKAIHKNIKRKKSANNKTNNSLRQNSKLKENSTSLKSNVKNVSTLNVKSKPTESHSCFHCQTIFESRSSLIEHLYKVINPDKIDKKIGFQKNRGTIESQDYINNTDKEKKKLSTRGERHNINKRLNNKRLSINENKINTGNLQKANENVSKRSKFIDDEASLNKLTQKSLDVVKDNLIGENDSDSYLSRDSPPGYSGDSSDENESEQNTTLMNAESPTTNKKTVYQCFICSQYFNKSFSNHLREHNVKLTSDVDKTVFHSQCKFCPLKLSSINSYNSHVTKFHHEKLTTKINLNKRAFQTVIFKCVTCNVFFLSTNEANSHSTHQDISFDWKCLECKKLFKLTDKVLHMTQHTLSKNVTAYTLCESALKRVLFKCLRCAVHFSEEEYFMHYKTCDSEIPNSAYCNTCDVLINKNDMALHERSHKNEGLQLPDFNFIESDIMVNNITKAVNGKTDSQTVLKLSLTYCNTCKCFLGDIGKTRKVHIEKRCDGLINPRTCMKCGLIFTSRGYLSHKMLHDKIENLSMQTYYFYDIVTNEKIHPPIPKYPQCNICEVHFLNKQVIKGHECSQQHFTVCSICQIKLTEAAYKLHINFHKYKLTPCASNKIQKTTLKLEEPTPCSISGLDTAKNTTNDDVIPDDSRTTTVNANYLYTCIICDITVDMYDKVIEHCHEHYDCCIRTNSQKQVKSNVKFNKSAVIFKFDPFYMRFKNDAWIKHIFGKVTEEIEKNILEHSIYKFECRFKMEEIQSGPISLALYKCDICRSYLGPNALYMHAKEPCKVVKKHPCSICGLCFASSDCQKDHEKVHNDSNKISITSYRIIIYNKTEHLQFNRMMIMSRHKFVLYQCRNCERVVDKMLRGNHQCQDGDVTKCSYCGLLFGDQEFNMHKNKHKEFLYFEPQNMKLIMFGKLGSQKDNKLKPTFDGTVFDLTFYKCINCGLCLKSRSDISKHKCVAKTYKTQCPKCYLSFLKKELHEHLELHENNVELSYDDFNSNVITFDLSSLKTNTDKEAPLNSLELIKSINQNEKNANENINSNEIQKIYKCPCGLHFLEELSARKHNNNCNARQKICKQICMKCDLLFTPGELFDHLLKHHNNKKITYKYDIITLTEE